MAHFALIQDGIVQRVEVVNNDVIATPAGNDSELKGKRFMVSVYPDTQEADWVQCSYSGSMRGVYPGIGYLWDGTKFITPVAPIPEQVKDAAV